MESNLTKRAYHIVYTLFIFRTELAANTLEQRSFRSVNQEPVKET